MHFIYDGKIMSGDSFPVHPGNRALRYGDGLFETMCARAGRVLLFPYHLDRLSGGMRLLQFAPGEDLFRELGGQIARLCEINACYPLARVRLNVFRGEGDLFAEAPPGFHYLVEAAPLPETARAFNERGLSVILFPHARKSCDLFSNLKSNNYLCSVMAARYARQHGCDDALLLNNLGRVAESAIANVFVVKDGTVYTPPLVEGCVAGVMRRYLLDILPANGFPVKERALSAEEVMSADEVFLTNALRRLQPVACFDHKTYARDMAAEIHALIAGSLQ